MKLFKHSCLIAFLLTFVSVSFSQQPRISQRGHIEQTVGSTEIKITYHRPNKKGRVLWGDTDALVPNGKVWRAGANEATLFEVNEDVMVNGKPLSAGKYSFYAIPNEGEWTLIFNKTWDQWGTVYEDKTDALRVTVKPSMSDESKESMSYTFEDVTADSVQVILAWDKMRIPFTVRIGKEPTDDDQNSEAGVTPRLLDILSRMTLPG